MGKDEFWTRIMRQRVSRRTLVRTGAVAGVGLWTGTVLGCGSGQGSGTSNTGQGSGTPAATSSSGTPATAKPKYGGELRFAASGNMTSVDPMKANMGGDFLAVRLYGGLLLNVADDGTLEPTLAQSYEIPDPQTIIIKLRPGVKFHDGTDLDAAAVKFNIERAQDPKTKANNYANFKEITKVDIPDSLTVKLSLAAPDSSLLITLYGGAGPMVSPAAVQKWGDDFERHVAAAGPYQVDKYTPDAELVLKRFDGYVVKDANGGQLPYLDRIVFKIIPDPAAQLAALQAGDVDYLTSVDPTMVDQIKSNRDITVSVLKQAGTVAYKWYLERPPTNDINLRKAISYGIDREEIVKSIYGGYGAPAKGALMPTMWAYDPTIEGFPYDLAKAKDYLAKAGYANGIKLKIGCFPQMKTLSEAVQGHLKRAGMDVTVDAVDPATLSAGFAAPDSPYQMASTGYGTYADPDRLMTAFFTTDGVYNPGKQKVPEVDRLVAAARATYDQNERKKLYSQAQQVINDNVQCLFIVNGDSFKAARNFVRDVSAGPDSYGEAKLAWIDK